MGIENRAGVRETGGAALADKYIGAHGLLEPANLLRERGLRDPFLLCGFGEAACLHNSAEIADLMKLHNLHGKS